MKIRSDNLDPALIAGSGQCFRWNRTQDDKYELIAFGRYLTLKKQGDELELSCSPGEWDDIWADYLDSGTDYAGIGRLINNSHDEYLKKAYKMGSGIRILKQDLWETVISFMISQNNNIKRIRNSIEAICVKAAVPLKNDCPEGKYAFPGPYDVDTDFFNDKSLGLGYREDYLSGMYEYARLHEDFPDRLKSMDHEDAFRELKSFKGIGDKVANCICLFGLHHIDAFPVDTHIRQILETYYPDGFDLERYKGFNGIIQQYMFNYKLNSPSEPK
ncbi:MAG: 8-oxoguanine DNA glycosylase [Lachnospiraceae bacterium]|nr:8-oxoguanine DNA glycosylase [Lachnospiraceae bacterium]